MESTTKPVRTKPAKPYPTFPLFPHATRRWAKKIGGKFHYFGPWENPDAALAEWLRQKDDLLAGREAHKPTEDLTVKEAVDAFLESREAKLKSGELTARTFRDYFDTGKRIAEHFGRTTPVSSLKPADFKAYAEKIGKWSAVTRGNEIQRVRTTFRYAAKNDLIPKVPSYGSDFDKPSAKLHRKEKQERPERYFSREELTTLLAAADTKMKAMILLGVNCGLGNSDISGLDRGHLHLDEGFLEQPRPKNYLPRRAALWPETVKAVRDVLAFADSEIINHKNIGKPHYHPANPADAEAVFITHQQLRYVVQDEKTNRDSVAQAFGKLLRSAGLKQEGVNFYALRHTFRTVAAGTKDFEAVDRAMGHAPADTGHKHYTKWRKDEEENRRLRAVADHVRAWLFPEVVAKEKAEAEAKAKAAKKKGKKAAA